VDPSPLYIAGVCVAALVGLVAWIGRTIARGNWVPRSTYEDAMTAARREGERNDHLGQQMEYVASGMRTMLAFVQAMQKSNSREGQDDEGLP